MFRYLKSRQHYASTRQHRQCNSYYLYSTESTKEKVVELSEKHR